MVRTEPSRYGHQRRDVAHKHDEQGIDDAQAGEIGYAGGHLRTGPCRGYSLYGYEDQPGLQPVACPYPYGEGEEQPCPLHLQAAQEPSEYSLAEIACLPEEAAAAGITDGKPHESGGKHKRPGGEEYLSRTDPASCRTEDLLGEERSEAVPREEKEHGYQKP